MYVCVCNAVTEQQLRQAINKGAITVQQLKQELGVATRCGACHDCLKDYLKQNFMIPTTGLGTVTNCGP